MKEQILSELRKLEKEQNIRVLYAVESGSRAWGFASTNSDWDVRFIYVHPLDWYLSIQERKDNYTKILPNDIDLGGWELRKSLNLFRKSNPPLLEWLRSPIVYYEDSSFINGIREFSQEYFNPKSTMYHCLHMAERNFRQYLKNDVVIMKKYFYVLRPVLACMWIEERDTMAPMEFITLVETQIKDPLLKTEVDKLLRRKMAGEELDLEPKVTVINDFLESKIEYFNNYLSKYQFNKEMNIEKLNAFFRNFITN
ncbi:MAG TPA: hypothetical protein DD381_00190 [Lentisphaeria bacterium]|nr:MAG: hypothetical protein A2X47_05545 [Lentisphaerae bacterium GWF2_38_69]HBM14760.1 hypothetical protein [Lentisphaeria bacterium]